MILTALLLVVAQSSTSWGSSAWDIQGKGAIGARGRDYTVRDEAYGSPIIEGELVPTYTSYQGLQLSVSAGGRFFQLDDYEVEPTSAYIKVAKGNFSLKLGYQTLSWGTSFAFFVADLVNPKDLRDPLNTDPSWINLSTPMANIEYFFTGGGLQLFYTPFPRDNKYPKTGGESDFLYGQNLPYTFGTIGTFNPDTNNAEYGGKINYVFQNGLEANLFGLRHWNRTPLYQLNVVNGANELVPQRYQLQSYGVGFSYDMDRISSGVVIRGDFVYHSAYDRSSIDNTTYSQGEASDFATGFDFNSTRNIEVALQIVGHFDSASHDFLATAKVSSKFFRQTLEMGVTVIEGVIYSELWVQPKITWYPSKNFETEILYDLLYVDQTQIYSLLHLLYHQDRAQASIRYLF